MKRNLLYLAIAFFTLSSCEFKCNIGKTDDVSTTKENGGSSDKSGGDATYQDNVNTKQVMNDIELTASGGVKVYRAMLTTESGSLNKDNSTALGVPIYLTLNIEDGWKEEDGKSYIGASQIVTTDNGTEVLSTGDMLASYDESGMKASDAKFVTLKASVSNITGAIDHFVVNFRVWDKKGSGEIKGSYKFKIKE